MTRLACSASHTDAPKSRASSFSEESAQKLNPEAGVKLDAGLFLPAIESSSMIARISRIASPA
jgi:hypothetical protein